MAFQISPGVKTSEVDLTTIVPSIATSDGGTVGFFTWGPGDEVTLVDSQDTLKTKFGAPNTALHGAFWWSAANFLSYSNRLHIVRAVGSRSNNAVFAASQAALIKNETEYADQWETYGSINGGGKAWDTQWFIARYPGEYGNNIRVSMIDSTPGMYSNAVSGTLTCSAGATEATVSVACHAIGDLITVASGPTGEYKITKVSGTTITVTPAFNAAATTQAITRNWEFNNQFDSAPGTSTFASARAVSNDELHIAVSDATGAITGTVGSLLETYPYASKLYDALKEDGSSNYYKSIIENQSNYIFVAAQPTDASVSLGKNNWGQTVPQVIADVPTGGMGNINRSTLSSGVATPAEAGINPLPVAATLRNGGTSTAVDSALQTGWDLFADPDSVDISLAITGPVTPTTARYVIDNITDKRKDCVAFISPERTDVVGVTSQSTITTNVTGFRNTGLASISSSYAVMDSGWKYQFDKYNNVYRWVPLNGDIAGLCARTDDIRDPWWSPAGFQRGNIKNVVKLAWNPTKTYRDTLYKNGINPVVTFPGQGTVLFGDKTLLTRPSAFDRINVRRLFITLEKSISIAAQFSLFEFNDSFTRSQFRNMVDPFLREVQGRRGITDYRVICDETNNTGEVIDRNEFVGDIYIKPARSINFIQLNFIATKTGVDFNELIGS